MAIALRVILELRHYRQSWKHSVYIGNTVGITTGTLLEIPVRRTIQSTKYIKSTTYTSQPPLTRDTSLSHKNRPTRGNATGNFIACTNSPSSKPEASTSIEGLFIWTANNSS